MNTITRHLLTAALLASLSACGNKGPLVQAGTPAEEQTEVAPATETPATDTPATTEPATTPATTTDPATEPAVNEAEPVPADPVEPPPPATDDGTP